MAMRQAIKEEIPEQQYYHDPDLQNKDGYTVCYYLFNNGLQVPENWQDQQYKRPIRQFFKYRTEAHCKSLSGQIPDKKDYHDPNITDDDGKTVEDYLQENSIPVPNQWYSDNNITPQKPEFIQQAIYGIIPKKPDNIQSDYKTEFGYTVAMLLAKNGIIPSKEWEHKSELRNKKYDTVAILLAYNKIVPPKQWQHDPDIKNWTNQYVERILKHYNIEVPQCWKYSYNLKEIEYHSTESESSSQSNFGRSQAMLQAQQGQIPDKKYQHDPIIIDIYYNTVAMILAEQGIIPPKEWEHEPELQNKFGYTVAMLLACKGIIPPKQWEHDKLLKTNNDQTVGMMLAYENVIPPEQWMHDINIHDLFKNSIKSNLEKYNYIYIDGQFKLNVQIEIKKGICQTCLMSNKREFVKTRCGTNTCLKCYKKLIQAKDYKQCPICKWSNWTIPLYQEEQNDNKNK